MLLVWEITAGNVGVICLSLAGMATITGQAGGGGGILLKAPHPVHGQGWFLGKSIPPLDLIIFPERPPYQIQQATIWLALQKTAQSLLESQKKNL